VISAKINHIGDEKVEELSIEREYLGVRRNKDGLGENEIQRQQ